jgi:2-polyprenyl-6-methoxyphenol hydroxylase-like FAD-dependent oxidoreductase
MRIVCVGGGPAGLYLAILMKLRGRDHDLTVFERSPRGSTYGWGWCIGMTCLSVSTRMIP